MNNLRIRYIKGKLPKELNFLKGLTGSYLIRTRFILINLNNIVSRLHLKWVIAHELGHHCMRHDISRKTIHQEELEANTFALKLLGKRAYKKAIALYWPRHLKRYPTVRECLELAE